MDVGTKDFLSIVGGALTFAFTFGGLLARQQSHNKRIARLERILTSGEDGGAPFITGGEHDKMRHDCQTHILSEVKHNEDKLTAVHDTLVDFKKCHDEKHETTIKAITRLETKLDERAK